MPLPLNMLMNKAERAGLAVGWRSPVGNKEMIVTTSSGPCTVVSLSQCLCEYLSLSLSLSEYQCGPWSNTQRTRAQLLHLPWWELRTEQRKYLLSTLRVRVIQCQWEELFWQQKNSRGDLFGEKFWLRVVILILHPEVKVDVANRN